MRDDSLTLPVLSEAPPIEAGAATLYVLDDGDGTARLYARSDDGSQFELTPPLDVPPTLPALALTTAATHGPTSYVPLVTDAPTVTFAGVAHRDIAVGETLEVAWPQLGGSVGWMDVAVLSGPGTASNPQIGVVASADVTATAGTSAWLGAALPVTAPIARGSALWVTITAWSSTGAPLPMVQASVFATHHAALGPPGWRPTIAGPTPIGWAVYVPAGTTPARPVVATVLLP